LSSKLDSASLPLL